MNLNIFMVELVNFVDIFHDVHIVSSWLTIADIVTCLCVSPLLEVSTIYGLLFTHVKHGKCSICSYWWQAECAESRTHVRMRDTATPDAIAKAFRKHLEELTTRERRGHQSYASTQPPARRWVDGVHDDGEKKAKWTTQRMSKLCWRRLV